VKNPQSFKEIDIIYLFGSYSKDTSNRMSDIDLAVSFMSNISFKGKIDILININELFGNEYNHNVDITVFEDANLVLRREIIYYGEVIFCRDEEKRILQQVSTIREYEDYKYYSNKYNQILALSVKNNGLYSNIKKYEVPSYDR
jgi:predicted nucleotidyltransferase